MHNEAARQLGTDAGSDEPRFGRYYFEHDCGRPYRRDDHWLGFFGDIADRIIERLHPTSVLDAGCAWGFLVEALRKRGVSAWGVDVSEYAISNVDESIKEYCRQGSLTEPITDRYDLITCIEVIEHLSPRDGETAIAHLCAATDRILVSSTPFDYAEPTHLNVQPPEDWSAMFAQHGFIRSVDFDASFLTPWAVLYERSDRSLQEVVRRYDRVYSRLKDERQQLRTTTLTLQARLEELSASGYDTPLTQELRQAEDENARLAEELLTARETIIAHERFLGEALANARRLEAELVRYEQRMEQLDAILRSRSWRIGGSLHRLARRLARRA